jgi:ABC-type bacteriocin/lantibiotic exporter with double-glycine peptidase domain
LRRLEYLLHLLRFAFSANRLLYLATAATLASLFVELAAMSSLLPLANLAIGQPVDEGYVLMRAFRRLNIEPGVRSFLLCFAWLLALRIVTQFVAEGLSLKLGKKIHAQLSSRSFDEIVHRIPIAELERKSIGYFITLAGDESFRASNLVIMMSQFAGVAALAALYYLAILYFSPAVALAVLAFMALSLLALYSAFRESHALGARQVEQSQSAGSLFLDVLNGLRGVRAFSAERQAVERYRAQIFRYVHTLFLIDFLALTARLVSVLILVVVLLVLVYSGWLLAARHVDVAVLLTSIALLMRFFPVAGQALNLFLRVASDARSGQDITQMIVSTQETAGTRKALGAPVSRIEIQRLAFSYEPGKPVLRDVRLEFVRGCSYTLLGPSGTGKSTVLDLLLAFHAPQSGTIRINGVPLAELSTKDLRRRVLLLGQQLVVFNDTVANNISFGAEVEPSAIERAAQLACIHDTIQTLPQGYATKLSYRGTNLSGGQLQRIGLARALVRQPDVLILDESTSALDPSTRDVVVGNILREFADRIVIFVTHDRSVARCVDVVYDLSILNVVTRECTKSTAAVSGGGRDTA